MMQYTNKNDSICKYILVQITLYLNMVIIIHSFDLNGAVTKLYVLRLCLIIHICRFYLMLHGYWVCHPLNNLSTFLLENLTQIGILLRKNVWLAQRLRISYRGSRLDFAAHHKTYKPQQFCYYAVNIRDKCI